MGLFLAASIASIASIVSNCKLADLLNLLAEPYGSEEFKLQEHRRASGSRSSAFGFLSDRIYNYSLAFISPLHDNQYIAEVYRGYNQEWLAPRTKNIEIMKHTQYGGVNDPETLKNITISLYQQQQQIYTINIDIDLSSFWMTVLYA